MLGLDGKMRLYTFRSSVRGLRCAAENAITTEQIDQGQRHESAAHFPQEIAPAQSARGWVRYEALEVGHLCDSVFRLIRVSVGWAKIAARSRISSPPSGSPRRSDDWSAKALSR